MLLFATHRRGSVCATVPDDEFCRGLTRFNWFILPNGYVFRHLPRKVGEPRRSRTLHKEIFEHYHGPVPSGLQVDHIDANKLNCLPDNLRAATATQNQFNRGPQKNSKSGIKGVAFWTNNFGRSYWHARVSSKGKRFLDKTFPPTEEGLRAATEAVKRTYQELGIVNTRFVRT